MSYFVKCIVVRLTMRFRLKEMEREFQQEREILLLTANRLISQFTDSQGELLSMLENLKELAQAKQQMTKAYNAYD